MMRDQLAAAEFQGSSKDFFHSDGSNDYEIDETVSETWCYIRTAEDSEWAENLQSMLQNA